MATQKQFEEHLVDDQERFDALEQALQSRQAETTRTIERVEMRMGEQHRALMIMTENSATRTQELILALTKKS